MSILKTVSDPTDLATPGTPQYDAAEWIISTDESVRCPDDEKLVQRYVMALFYFSTNGDDWNQCGQNDDTCGLMTPFIDDEKFLSSSHECEWAGAECDAKECITEIEFGKFQVIVFFNLN